MCHGMFCEVRPSQLLGGMENRESINTYMSCSVPESCSSQTGTGQDSHHETYTALSGFLMRLRRCCCCCCSHLIQSYGTSTSVTMVIKDDQTSGCQCRTCTVVKGILSSTACLDTQPWVLRSFVNVVDRCIRTKHLQIHTGSEVTNSGRPSSWFLKCFVLIFLK